MNNAEQIKLETIIQDAQKAYYEESNPTMLDSEFDILWDELQNKFPESEVLKKVGNDSSSNWPKARHLLMMGSQHKSTTEEEIRNWVRLNKIVFPVMVQHKLDGLSLEVIYEDGKLVQAITRGDGTTGDDVTSNALNITGIPKTISDKRSTSFRGEVCLPKSIFEEKFSEYANPRNLASGFVKKHGSVNCKYLQFIAYDFSVETHAWIKTNEDLHAVLTQQGFTQPHTELVESIAEFIEITEAQLKRRPHLDIQIDGLVLKSRFIDIEDRKEDRPKKQIAWKFPAEEATTILQDVEWQISGETLTPVAILKPVFIDGSTVSKASLVNLAEIERLMLGLGSKVVICKRGDIIPKIERQITHRNDSVCLRNINPPTECPICGSPLQMDESTRLYCPYIFCTAKITQKVIKWVEHIGILGLGKEMVARFVDDELVSEIADLYDKDFKEVAVNSTNLKKATEKALNELYKVKELPLEKFIAGFNIRAFGERHTKKLIVAGYDTIDNIRNMSEDEFCAIDGLGEKLFITFSRAMRSLRSEMENVLKYISITEPVQKGNKLDGLTFVITGKLNTGSRKEIQEMIENAGGKVGSSVNSKTDFLVNNDYLSNSSKNKKALDLNVDIISEEALLGMIKIGD